MLEIIVVDILVWNLRVVFCVSVCVLIDTYLKRIWDYIIYECLIIFFFLNIVLCIFFMFIKFMI